jgi:hypothetical protein
MVVFGDPMGVALALKAAEEQLVVEWRVPESEEPIGVKGRWMRGRHSEHPNIFFGSLSQHVQQVTLYYIVYISNNLYFTHSLGTESQGIKARKCCSPKAG